MGVVRARRVADDDAFRLRRAPDAQPDRAVAADVARLYRPAAWHVAGARHGGLRQRRELSDGLARRPVRAPASARARRRLLVAAHPPLRSAPRPPAAARLPPPPPP